MEIRKEISLIEERLIVLKDQAYRISPNYSPMPKSPSVSSRIEEAVTKIVDMENKLINDRLDLIDMETRIGHMCNLVDDRTRRNILVSAGCLGKTTFEIADEFGYSERHVRRILRWCYQEIARKMS